MPFMQEQHLEIWTLFKKFCDINLDPTANFRYAIKGKVCKHCRQHFCAQDVCKTCYRTIEGKAIAIKLRVRATVKSNLERWGATNPMSSVKGKRHHKKKVIEKLGVANAMFLESVKRKHQKNVKTSHNTEEYKAKASAIRRVPGFMDKVVAKSKATSIKCYGVDNPMKSKEGRAHWESKTKKWRTVSGKAEARRRALKTIREKYGVDNVMELGWVKQKMRDTWVENYGVDHPLKDMTVRRKAISAALSSRFKVKSCKLSGKTFSYMGYEKPAIEKCIQKYGVNNVKTTSEIDPIVLGDTLYFPDIYVESKGVYIEVKSTWTMFNNRMTFWRCRQKAYRCVKAGVIVRWAICSESTVLTLLPEKWYYGTKQGVLESILEKLPKKESEFVKRLTSKWKRLGNK